MPYKDSKDKRAHGRAWYKRNPDFYRRRRKRRRKQNIAYLKKWRETHRDYMRKWRKKNRKATKLKDYKRRGLKMTSYRPKPKDGRCQRCRKKKRLCLDHDHKTGRFRGWLCSKCNTGIGMLGDTLPDLVQAVKYLHAATNILS